MPRQAQSAGGLDALLKGFAAGGKLKAFDLVIAQPMPSTRPGDENTSRSGADDAPYLLTPGAAFQAGRGDPLSVNLRRADYFAESGTKRFLANRVYDPAVASNPAEACKTCALHAEVAKATAEPSGSGASKAYETLALTAMQKFCGSDIALLQHRDVFGAFENAVALWPSTLQPNAQQLLDEVLWKGDFAFCVPVQGSTIKKVIEESAAFDKQDRDDLSIEVEKGRGLSFLSIQRDPNSGTPAIRGQAIEDNKLYGVAMTDYLAFGNTGCPELSSEAIQPVVRVVSLKDLNRLTGLACKELPEEVSQGSCQSESIPASEYFAAIRQRPFDTTHGLTAWIELRRWATRPLQPQPNGSTLLEKSTNEPENVIERRGLWWFMLQNVSLGYNLNFIKGSDRNVPGNFAGNNSFSQLSTPESSQLNFWGRARGGYSFPRFIDFYLSGEAKYSRLAVRNSIGDGNFGEYQLTLGNNLLRGEIGVNTKPLTKRIPIRFLSIRRFVYPSGDAVPTVQCAAGLRYAALRRWCDESHDLQSAEELPGCDPRGSAYSE